MTIIEQIKTEIERLIEESDFDESANLYSLLSFLSTLESEKPMNQKGLEEEYKDYVENDPVYSKLVNRNAGFGIARHFAEWGYLRAAEKYNEIEYNRQRAEESVRNGLEEAAQQYAEGPECTWVGTTALEYAFIAGAKWQAEQLLKSSPMPEDTVLFNKGVEEGKRLMMEEAVEGIVCYGSKGAYIETDFLGEYDTDVYGNPGDKVRVLIIKE